MAHEADAVSIISSHISKEEQALGETALGERLPYNDYTTIDWLHELVGGPLCFVGDVLTTCRSKTRSGTVPFTAGKGFDID